LDKLIAGASGWGFVDQAVVSLASFAAALVVGRFGGSEQLGIFSVALSLFWLLAGVANALVWTPFTSRAPHLSSPRSRYYAGSSLIHLAVFGGVVAVLLLAVGAISWTEAEWLWPMCAALTPFTLLVLLREHLRRYLFAHLSTRSLLGIDVPIALGQLFVLAALVVWGRVSFATALWAMAAPNLWCFVWIVRHRERFRFERRRALLDWSYNFAFGRWLLVVSVAWLLGEASFQWLVGWFHGERVLGQLSAPWRTVMFVNPIMLTVQNLLRSQLSNRTAEAGPEALRGETLRATGRVALGFGALLFVIGVRGGGLVELLFGSEFAGLGPVVVSLCVGVFFHVLTFPVEAALAAIQAGRALLAASLVRLALILTTGVPLIIHFGPLGVGIALSIASCGAGAVAWWHFTRRRPDVR
jgi:O-antigen/teichoic acid export membrane protein